MKDIVERWITRLRDPNTGHCLRFLRVENCFCAIGLLLDVIDPTRWVENRYVIYTWGDSCRMIPDEVLDKFKRRWLDKIMTDSDDNVPFSKIADYIERTWHENTIHV